MAKLFGFSIENNEETPKSVVSPVPDSKEDQSDYYMTSGFFGNYVDLEGVFKNEFQLIRRYREMALHPEVDGAVEDVIQESIVSDTNESYTLSNVNDKNNNIRTNLGLDFIKNNGWSYKSNYERNQNENGYSDILYIGATYLPENDNEYASLSLDGEKTFVNYTKNIYGFNLEFNSNYSLFREVPDYGANIKISSIF